MGDLPIVQDVHCDTAIELLKAISPTSEYFLKPSRSESWGFRGHGFDNYRLLPIALRPEKVEELHNLADSPQHIRKHRELAVCQARAEADVLCKFLKTADYNGLALPEDSQELRSELEDIYERLHDLSEAATVRQLSHPGIKLVDWPPLKLLSLLALAQHVGVPTRLLDWTRSSYIAAYFAAEDAVSSRKSQKACSDLLSVWALQLGRLNVVDRVLACAPGSGVSYLTETFAPRAANPNLHAQNGFFTAWKSPAITAFDKVDARPADKKVQGFTGMERFGGPLLYHFTMPRSEAGRLLWLLARHDITAARVYPGYRGAVAAMRERLHWEVPVELG